MAKDKLLMVELTEDGTIITIRGSLGDIFTMYGKASCGVLKALADGMANDYTTELVSASDILKTMLAGVIGGVADAFRGGEIDADLKPIFRKALEEALPTMTKDVAFFFDDKEESVKATINNVREAIKKGREACGNNDIDGALEQLVEIAELLSKVKPKKESTK